MIITISVEGDENDIQKIIANCSIAVDFLKISVPSNGSFYIEIDTNIMPLFVYKHLKDYLKSKCLTRMVTKTFDARYICELWTW